MSDSVQQVHCLRIPYSAVAVHYSAMVQLLQEFHCHEHLEACYMSPVVMEVVWLQEIAPLENELQIWDQILSEVEGFHVVVVKILLSMLLDDIYTFSNSVKTDS